MEKQDDKILGRWNVYRLRAVGAIAALWIVSGFIGSGVQAALGFPGASGIVMAFFTAMWLSLVVFSVNTFGAGTLLGGVYGLIAIPLPTLGAPGFYPKVLLGLAAGFVVDLCWRYLRHRPRLCVSIGGVLANETIAVLFLSIAYLLKLPGLEKTLKMAGALMVVAVVLGSLGGLTGLSLYNRLKNTSAMHRLGLTPDAGK